MMHDVVRFRQFGAPEEVLQVESQPTPTLGSGEVLVRMIASPINPSDLIPVRGAYSHRISLPCIPGYEGVGVIEEIGASVPQSLLGRQVLPLRGEGTWQEYVKTSAEWVVSVPDTLDVEVASQLYINPITAWVICSQVLQLKPDDVLVINAGGSAIGRIFAQLSRVFGYRLIAVTRHDAHTQELLALGAWQVVNSSTTSVDQAVRELTGGRGADAAIDSIGGPDGEVLMESTRSGGSVLSIGLLSGISVNWGAISKRTGVGIQLFWLRHWNGNVSTQKWHAAFDNVVDLVQRNQLQLMNIEKSYDLRNVRQAVHAAQALGRRGKILLTM